MAKTHEIVTADINKYEIVKGIQLIRKKKSKGTQPVTYVAIVSGVERDERV